MELRITKDTNEEVLVPAPPVQMIDGDGDGLDWMRALRRPWIKARRWGRLGYELGNWPDVVFALSTFRDQKGILHGYCTYVEGEITPRWYRSREERDLAVSQEAFAYWADGQASGPPDLQGRDPHDFFPVDGLCEPYLAVPEELRGKDPASAPVPRLRQLPRSTA